MAYIKVFEATGKAKCRLCKETIKENDFAFGISYQNGTWQNFEQYHLSCVNNFIEEQIHNIENSDIIEKRFEKQCEAEEALGPNF